MTKEPLGELHELTLDEIRAVAGGMGKDANDPPLGDGPPKKPPAPPHNSAVGRLPIWRTECMLLGPGEGGLMSMIG